MDAVLRRIGLKKGEPRESEARQKLQKQLFAYNKCVDHGFPNKPSSLAYDPKLRIAAFGTKTGAVRIHGAPGVEFSGQHEDEEVAVSQLYFLPGQGRLITLCSDNSLHLWEITLPEEGVEGKLEAVRHLSVEASKLKTITACCLTASADQLLVGTEGGNIHVLNVYSFKLTEQIIYQDTVIQNVPDDFKVNPGAVESIQQHPSNPNQFLIGYNRGLIVFWDSKENSAVQTYNASQQLESLAWYSDGSQFMSAHADGSYIIWSSTDSTKPKEQGSTPYGPFACKAINKVQWKTAKADTFIIFSGGMPRASCGDRHTVSVMQGNQHVVFDFTSRVIDFVTLNSFEELSEIEKGKYDEPHTLLVLAEEELVAIDLQSDNWQTYRAPYLCSLHSSAITCAQHIANIPQTLWTKITDVGEQQFTSATTREWPITGGKNLSTNGNGRDLLLTGHEDGSIRFWDASTSAMRLMYKLNTANIFGLDVSADQTHNDDEDWPPFRKVGTFDPYSDDPRLGIQKINLCPLSESLVIGGTAGQVVILQFEREDQEQELKHSTLNIVDTSDGFVWKGHEALPVREGEVKFAAGFQPVSVVQLQPPAAITALALHSEWQLVSAGTAHGFGVYDYCQKKEVVNRCTLNPAELSGNTAASTPRRKSFKKSLRESFRRLRRGRSEKKPKRAEKTEESGKLEEQKTEAKTEGDAPAAEATETTPAAPAEGATNKPAEPQPAESPKPVERQVEARDKTDDGMASMVRSLYFADTFLLNGQNHTPTLWAGTNAGTIYIYQVTLPASDKRDSDAVQCVLAKEIQLQHRAPVIAIAVIDRSAQPLPAPLEVQNERAKAPDMTGGHHVVVVSEEQFKIFSLPSLKANNKFKLTAHEGSKVRKVAFVNFRSKSDERYSENDLVCLTNLGEVHVFTIPQLRRQLKNECVNKENISGIASSVFTQNGEGFFLGSPSEFTRFSVSVRHATRPLCDIALAEDARPELEPLEEPQPEPEPEPEETPAAEATEGDATAAAADETAAGGDAETATTEAAAAPSEEAEKPKEEAAEKPKEGGDNKLEESVLTLGNDSVLSADDVRVHLSEQSSHVVSSSVTRTVVTRTIHSETTGDGTVTSESTTVQTMSSGDVGAASGGDSGAGGDSGDTGGAGGGEGNTNLDDDAKLTTKQMSDSPETTDTLEELHITEEGDNDDTRKIADDATAALADEKPPVPDTPLPDDDETVNETVAAKPEQELQADIESSPPSASTEVPSDHLVQSVTRVVHTKIVRETSSSEDAPVESVTTTTTTEVCQGSDDAPLEGRTTTSTRTVVTKGGNIIEYQTDSSATQESPEDLMASENVDADLEDATIGAENCPEPVVMNAPEDEPTGTENSSETVSTDAPKAADIGAENTEVQIVEETGDAAATLAEQSQNSSDTPLDKEQDDSPPTQADTPLDQADTPPEQADTPLEQADTPLEQADTPLEQADTSKEQSEPSQEQPDSAPEQSDPASTGDVEQEPESTTGDAPEVVITEASPTEESPIANEVASEESEVTPQEDSSKATEEVQPTNTETTPAANSTEPVEKAEVEKSEKPSDEVNSEAKEDVSNSVKSAEEIGQASEQQSGKVEAGSAPAASSAEPEGSGASSSPAENNQ